MTWHDKKKICAKLSQHEILMNKTLYIEKLSWYYKKKINKKFIWHCQKIIHNIKMGNANCHDMIPNITN